MSAEGSSSIEAEAIGMSLVAITERVTGSAESGELASLRRRTAIKRTEDIVFALLLLLLATPVMIVVASAVRWDSPGPILFRQRRLGLHNREFVILKFRSMRCAPIDESGERQATRNDVRVSRVGRFLRKTSIDELPQLFNVLRGEMSLVGPRPHAVAHHEKYLELIENYAARHRMHPGLTGWAQVNGARGETETLDKMRRRVEFDLAYIDNWSLILDLKILLRTVRLVLCDPNAY